MTRVLGSTSSVPLNEPIIGIAATGDGNGYWLVARDGGVFTFGQAVFLCSPGGSGQCVAGIAATPTGNGYWLATAAGAVIAYGDADYAGSPSSGPITGFAA